MIARALILLAAVVACKCNCNQGSNSSSCPQLTPINLDLSQIAANQPVYVVFFPRNNLTSYVDNVCFTFFQVSGNNNTDNYIAYLSRVFNDSSLQVRAFITTEPQVGVYNFGSDACAFTDTVFAQVRCENNRTIYLSQRCPSYGSCPALQLLQSPSQVFGFSEVPGPISTHCMNTAIAVIRSKGLPSDYYVALPMKLSSQCVLNQSCVITTGCQTCWQC